MDPRIREHADIVVNHSVELAAGDNVVIDAARDADDLLVALMERIGDIGANPVVVAQRSADRFRRAYLRNHEADFEFPDHEMNLFEGMDVYIAIRSGDNVTETADVASETNAAYNRIRRPLLEERLSKRWVVTQYPTAAYAQLAEMSTEAYENFVWDAVIRDWDEQRDHQSAMAERLDDAEEVRIVSGDTTDLTMSVAGNVARNDFAQRNLPGGEVFTAPVPESVEGEVHFDLPLYHQGREVTDVYLRFDGGEVVDHSAARNEEVLREVLETDAGARRLGELGIGMNRSIDQFTYNMLFDEKMGDTVHLALGRAYESNFPDGHKDTANDSAIHVDMITDMSESSRIEIDGEVIQRNGRFRWEPEFSP